VEKIRLIIREKCLNKQIIKVEAADDNIIFAKTKPEIFATQIKGRTILEISRRGKYFWFNMDQGPCPTFHLGMTGSVKFKDEYLKKDDDNEDEDDEEDDCEHKEKKKSDTSPRSWPPNYWKCIITFNDNTELAVLNKRRLGKIWLFDNPLKCPPVSKLGFDPLLDMMAWEEYYNQVSRRSTPIKALLLNQSFSAGVGNWIADEILYQSSIHPQRYTSTLTKEEIRATWEQIINVIQVAVKANNDHSKFPQDWLFHTRWGKRQAKTKNKPHTRNGERIYFVTVGGRTSAYVKERQKLDKESKKN